MLKIKCHDENQFQLSSLARVDRRTCTVSCACCSAQYYSNITMDPLGISSISIFARSLAVFLDLPHSLQSNNLRLVSEVDSVGDTEHEIDGNSMYHIEFSLTGSHPVFFDSSQSGEMRIHSTRTQVGGRLLLSNISVRMRLMNVSLC